MKLKKKYQKIYNLAEKYYRKGREKDDVHHLVVAVMMQGILKEVNLDEDVMMAAALLHDTGYSKIPPNKRKTHWAKKVKKDHMILGADIARKILTKLDYPNEKIDQVYQIILTHDNPELGIPIKNKEGKVLKEADILWMTTEEAFWLDVKRRSELTPTDWLKVLENRFTKEKAYTNYLTTKFSKKKTSTFVKKMKKQLKKNNVKN
jgi:putative nucleotidyltransferase with HDIG domain